MTQDTSLTQEVLKLNIKRGIETSLKKYPLVGLNMVDIIEVREEAKIYGTEE